MNEELPKWLKWAREIQQLSQTGMAFAVTDYEKQRYTKLLEIASEILEHQTQLDRDDVVKVLMEQPGYATPKIDVRAAVINNENKILLVQEKSDKR